MRKICLSIMLLVGLQTTLSQAAVVTFDYTAIGIPGGLGDATGATVVGQFGWDTSVADTDSDVPRGLYPMAGFWRGTITGGPQDGLSFDSGMHDTRTADNVYFGGHGDGLTILVASSIFPGSSLSFINLLDSGSDDALDSAALPPDINLSDWNFETRLYIAGLDFGATGNASNQHWYDLTGVVLHTSEVPLPASIYSFALALGILGGVGALRCRRKSAGKQDYG